MCIYGVAFERVGRPVAESVPRHEGRDAQPRSTPLWITTLLYYLKSPVQEQCDSSARTLSAVCHHLVSDNSETKMVLNYSYSITHVTTVRQRTDPSASAS